MNTNTQYHRVHACRHCGVPCPADMHVCGNCGHDSYTGDSPYRDLPGGVLDWARREIPYPDLDIADYEPPSYDLDDEICDWDMHCCDHCGHAYATANEEDLGFCRYCADDTVEDQAVNQGYRRPVAANTQPDYCPRCGSKATEVIWQTFMVSEPTLMVQCPDCQFHSYGVARSRRAGRKDWELRRVVIAEWNQLVR